MRRSALAVLLLLCGSNAAAQPAPPAAAAGATPRDIREVFLALPVPAAAPDRPILSRIAARLATRELRRAALDGAVAGRGYAILEPRNGYLELCFAASRGGECLGVVIVTYFNRSNGERLVVLQVPDLNANRVEDYFWRLAGGRFTPVDGKTLLPELGWADFWGDQPPPAGYSPRFLHDMGALRVAWPMEGTVAKGVVTPLGDGVGGRRGEELAALYEMRRFVSVDLVWDRQRGVFTKGKRTPYEPEEEDDHDHDHE